MRFARFAIALGFLISSLDSTVVFAATSTASFSVTATISSSCQVSAPSAAFGGYASAGRSGVSVNCTLPTQYNVSLSAESTADEPEATSPTKVLLNNALLSDSTHTLDRTRRKAAGTLANLGGGSSRAQALNGQTAQAWQVSSSAFADAITVTIAY